MCGILALFAATAARAQDPEKVDPQAFAVKLDNAHVRVLDYQSKPGDKEAMHTHPASVVYAISGCHLRYTAPDGKTTEVDVKAGEAQWRDPFSHAVENIGTSECHSIVVEVK
jgi:hypothetical protein